MAELTRNVVTLYGKPDCSLCDKARELLERLRDELGFELVERDITTDDRLHAAMFERIPVIALDDVELTEFFVDEAELRRRLGRVGGDELAPPRNRA